MNAALDELRLAATATRDLIQDANEGIGVLTADLKPVLDQLYGVLNEAEQAISAAKSQLKGDSEQLYQLGATLEELERASRSVREFFDYMERNPESLLRGKQE
jgi:paraquat-inducible protein B